MNKTVIQTIRILLLSVMLVLGNAPLVMAQTAVPATQNYTVLAPLPGTTIEGNGNCTGSGKVGTGGCTSDLGHYLPGIFNLMIGIGAGAAFVVITIGGLEYMLTDSLNVKMGGRQMIENALWGLGFLIFAYAILYTVNPALLNGSLNIATPVVPVAQVAGGTPTGGGKTGCTGADCKYSYTTSDSTHTQIAYKDCSNCVPLTIANTLPKTINGKPVEINADLATKLTTLSKSTAGLAMQVSEAWPPTVNHAEQGQYDGTSVDVTILKSRTNDDIKTFITQAKSAGLTAVYEVSTPAEADRVRAATGLSTSQVISVGYITGSHFSIYNK